MGPTTALQKPGGTDEWRARWRGRTEQDRGEVRMWHGGFMGGARRLFDGFLGGRVLSGPSFTVDCHLTETVSAN